ncbi:MAG TPA: endonuclease/exonuclease/phosphatase family protein [Candidatus Paceibacterota bacterium]|nr:endonuclease/exonuclease/phosphatase family protein [Candidatus Paceibacterota bacterium]
MRFTFGSFVPLLVLCPALLHAETFRVATYNLENYLDQPTETRAHPKSAASKAKIRENIRALQPDVIALQEVGSVSALEELRGSLKAEGLDFPFSEFVAGFDTNIHVAVLSKYPFAARRPHTNDTFLLTGRRFRVGRGIAEVDVQVDPEYSFTLISTHLKSKRPAAEADEAEQRLEEAKVLRKIIDANLTANPNANLVVLGDLNDTYNSPPVKTIIGRGKNKLVDTRPAERNGDNQPNPNPAWQPRSITWTHYFGAEDSYSRIDYLLLSLGMAREWKTNETYVLATPNWGVGSDHRPLVATFEVSPSKQLTTADGN